MRIWVDLAADLGQDLLNLEWIAPRRTSRPRSGHTSPLRALGKHSGRITRIRTHHGGIMQYLVQLIQKFHKPAGLLQLYVFAKNVRHKPHHDCIQPLRDSAQRACRVELVLALSQLHFEESPVGKAVLVNHWPPVVHTCFPKLLDDRQQLFVIECGSTVALSPRPQHSSQLGVHLIREIPVLVLGGCILQHRDTPGVHVSTIPLRENARVVIWQPKQVHPSGQLGHHLEEAQGSAVGHYWQGGCQEAGGLLS